MKRDCKRFQQMADIWFELNDQERDIIRAHARTCSRCRLVLEESEQLWTALEATRMHHRSLHYSGPVPTVPTRRAAPVAIPQWAWGIAIATICIWTGLHLLDQVSSEQQGQPSTLRTAAHMPSVPWVSPGSLLSAAAISHSDLYGQIQAHQRAVATSIHPYLRMPKPPTTTLKRRRFES